MNNSIASSLAISAATLFLTACDKSEASATPEEATADASVQCVGINECKGQSKCAVEGSHKCGGQNDCSGKGWLPTATEAECSEKGGTVKSA